MTKFHLMREKKTLIFGIGLGWSPFVLEIGLGPIIIEVTRDG